MNNAPDSQEQKQYFREWLWKAAVGLALIGFGASIAAEGATAKAKSAPFRRWFFVGTMGFVVMNTGLSLFGDAVKARTFYELIQNNEPNDELI